MPVGNESFKSSDSNRLTFDSSYANAFALVFLRTYSAADSWQCTCFRNNLICSLKFTFCNLGDEFRNLYHYRTALGTWLFPAFETSHCFIYSLLSCISAGNLLEVSCSNLRILLRHWVLYLLEINHGNVHLLSVCKRELCRELPVLCNKHFS